MFDDIRVYWGDHDWKAKRSDYRITGKLKKVSEERYREEPLGITVMGKSSNIHGNADVQVSVHMSRKMVYELFEKAMTFEQHYNPSLARLGKALLKELTAED